VLAGGEIPGSQRGRLCPQTTGAQSNLVGNSLTAYYLAVATVKRHREGESSMTLRITTLSENTAGSGEFLGELGLSVVSQDI